LVHQQFATESQSMTITLNIASGVYYVAVTNSADVRKLIKVVKVD